MAGSITKSDYEHTKQALLRLRNRPFQLQDFIRAMMGRSMDRKLYKKYEMRLYRLLETGAVRIIKFDGVERQKKHHRFYTIGDIDKWQPIVRREKRAQREAKVFIPRKAQTTDVEAIVNRLLEKAGLLGKREHDGAFTFALVASKQLEQVDPMLLIERLAVDKMHSWGRADLEALKDYHIFSSAPPLMSIPQWKEMGVDIIATVKARGKRQAEEAFLGSGVVREGRYTPVEQP